MSERIVSIKIKHVGEIGKIEEEAKKFIKPEMNGIDIGTGGMPILPQAISIDASYPGQYSEWIHLKGDARKLYWFKDSCMDYVFSSHCFEDFKPEEKLRVFREWIRVIKVGGVLVLYLPNEQAYRNYCLVHGSTPNKDHKDANFNIETVREIAKFFPVREIHSIVNHGDYCFFLVFKKVGEL